MSNPYRTPEDIQDSAYGAVMQFVDTGWGLYACEGDDGEPYFVFAKQDAKGRWHSQELEPVDWHGAGVVGDIVATAVGRSFHWDNLRARLSRLDSFLGGLRESAAEDLEDLRPKVGSVAR